MIKYLFNITYTNYIVRGISITKTVLSFQFSFVNSASDVFYLQNGFYRFNGKWKQRGFGRLGSKEIEHLDTIERDGKLLMKCRILRPKRLRSSILQDLVDQVGKFSEIERELNLNADKKRVWLNNLSSIEDHEINVSVPISLNYFEKNEV